VEPKAGNRQILRRRRGIQEVEYLLDPVGPVSWDPFDVTPFPELAKRRVPEGPDHELISVSGEQLVLALGCSSWRFSPLPNLAASLYPNALRLSSTALH
jgi:hypothetical protein